MQEPKDAAQLILEIISTLLGFTVAVAIQAYLLTLIVPVFALALTYGQAFLICLFLAFLLR